MKRIVYYTNQFFGQIGGEDMASVEPRLIPHAVGPGLFFQEQLAGNIVATLVCGDNYYNEHTKQARETILKMMETLEADFFLAGPSFNAGRFGVACGDLCLHVKNTFHIPVLMGANEESPALDLFRKEIDIIQTGKSAASMRKDAKKMAAYANLILQDTPLDYRQDYGLFQKGKRVNVFHNETGAKRAVDMLMCKLNHQPFQSEVPIPTYESVQPAKGLQHKSNQRIALVTTGGVVPVGNPHRLPAATAKTYVCYETTDKKGLQPGFYQSVHAGYDPVYANENPNRIAPFDILKELEDENVIGVCHPIWYTTTGNSTSVSDATRMGKEMAKELADAHVDGVILTSTWGTCTRCGATIAKELERGGIPTAHICTITPISKAVGASRIKGGVAIPYPVGNPELTPEQEHRLRKNLVMDAIALLQNDGKQEVK